MPYDQTIRRCRRWYAQLLRLYPRPYYEQFGEGMEQTFGDLLRERAEERSVVGRAVWLFVETFAGVIKENIIYINMQRTTTRIIGWAIGVALVLMIPLIAMQFTSGVNWSPSDFIFMGALLFGAGATYELLAKKITNGAYRTAVGLAIIAAVLLVWITGAVGIIGDEGNPVNLMYLAIVAVGFISAIVARFKPRGMSIVLFGMAIVQALVPVIALIISPLVSWGSPGVAGVFALNGFFAVAFLGSGLLFRQAIGAGSK